MEKIIKINTTLGKVFQAYELPVEDNMILIDFYFALQKLVKSLYPVCKTVDIYTIDFDRIALVSDNEEIYINPDYKHYNLISDLFDNDIDTLEILALDSPTVKDVLEEESLLEEALKNYNIDEE